MPVSSPEYCVNHPKTETLLHCNKCGKPVCIKCVVRTPVGYRCKECLNIQRAGYYTAAPVDYAITILIGGIASAIGGMIAALMGGFWFISIFYAPAAGGVIAEVIHRSIQRRRGKYLALIACGVFVIGGLVGGAFFPLVSALVLGRGAGLFRLGVFSLAFLASGLVNIGLWIYIALGVGTVYARLRS